MESSQRHKRAMRKKRALRVRKRVRGTQKRPRLCVVKTNRNVLVQLIDDEKGQTIASISTLSKEYRTSEFSKKNQSSAKQLGLKIAALAKQKDILKIVFNRGSFKYHGVLAAVAEGAREGGLEF